MTFLNKINDQWIPLQVNVFSRWVALQLNGKSNVKVEDITKDLSSGVALCELATILTKKQPNRNWVREPTRTVDMVQNCELAIKMFENDGVHFVGISGKDINDNKEKLILGLVWSLILHYSVVKSVENERENGLVNNSTAVKDPAREEKTGPETLMNWASDRTANYPHVDNFKPYNLGMCALLDTYVPEKINYDKLDPKDSENNTKLATNVMKEIGIPVLVLPEEIEENHNQVDPKTLLTQLSSAKFVLDKSFHGSQSFRRSGMLSETSQMSSEANQSEGGERIALNSTRTEEETIKARDANATGKYNGSNLIDLTSIPMDLNKQANGNQTSGSNLIDLNSIPVIPAGQRKGGQDSILAFGQNEKGIAANGAAKDGAAVESSSEVDSTSSEVDGYDESEEGDNAQGSHGHRNANGVNNGAAGFNGYDAHRNPIQTGVNGVNGVNNGAVGPDGKPIAGAAGFDANGHPLSSGVNGVNGNGFGASGANKGAFGPDGKPIAGAAGFDANGHPLSSGVNGTGSGVNGLHGASGAGVNGAAGAIGPDGKPISGVNGVTGTGVNGAAGAIGPDGKPISGVNGSTVNGNGFGVNGVNKGAIGPDGKPISGTAGFDANGHPLSSGANGNGFGVNGVNGTSVNGNGIGSNGAHNGVAGATGVTGTLGPDGKPIAGTAGFDSNGHPISTGVNGVNGNGFGVNGVNKGAIGPDGKPIAGASGFDANGHPLSSGANGNGFGVNGVNGTSVNGNGIGSNGAHNGVAGATGVTGTLGPDGKPIAGTAGFDSNGHPILGSGVNGLHGATGAGVNGAVGAVGPDGKPIAGAAGFDTNGHPLSSGVNGTGSGVNGLHGVSGAGVNGSAGAIGPDGKPISGVNGVTGTGANGISGAIGPDGKPISGVNGVTGTGINGAKGAVGPDGKPISGVNGVTGAVGPDGKTLSGSHGFDSNGHPIPSGANGSGFGVNGAHGVNDGVQGHGGESERDAALGLNGKVGANGKLAGAVDGAEDNVDGKGHSKDGKDLKVLTLEDKYLTRKMSIRHVKLCKPGEKNAYNAALPWYISISGKRRHDEVLRSQEFNNEDIYLTRRMSLPHFRFVRETPKPVEQVKSDDQVNEAKEKAVENIEENTEDDELLKEEAQHAIKQSPEEKVLTRKMSIRHVKLLKQGEKNYFEKNLKWYVSVSGKQRGSPEETKNVTRDFKISPEDVVLTRHMSLPHFRTPHPAPKPVPVAPKVDPEVEARNKANAEYDAQQAKNSIKQSPEDKVLTRKLSIRHIKLCKDGERNYFDNNLPWYVSISGKKRGSPEETKNVTRDFKISPEDVVLTRKMDLPHYNDPKCTESYKEEQKKLSEENAAKQREAKIAQDAEDKKYEEENAHNGIELTPEDKVLTRKMSIRHVKLCKQGEKNYHNAKLPWYVSISGKRRGSADECKANVRNNNKFGPEDIVLTRHMSLPHFVPIKSDDPIDETVYHDEIVEAAKTRDINLENEEKIEETPEQKAKEFNLEDKVLTRKLSIRHIRVLKPGEKNYKEPCLPWYVSTSGKWRGSHNEQKAVTRDVEFDQEDKLLTRKLNLPHYVRPKCDETGANNNYTTTHMFDVKKKWW